MYSSFDRETEPLGGSHSALVRAIPCVRGFCGVSSAAALFRSAGGTLGSRTSTRAARPTRSRAQTSSVSCGCFLTLCGEADHLASDWDTARPWRKRKGYKRVSLRNKNPWADCTLVPLGVRTRAPSVTSALPPHRAFGLTLQRVKSLISSLRRLVRFPDLKDGYGQNKTLDEL